MPKGTPGKKVGAKSIAKLVAKYETARKTANSAKRKLQAAVAKM